MGILARVIQFVYTHHYNYETTSFKKNNDKMLNCNHPSDITVVIMLIFLALTVMLHFHNYLDVDYF